MLLDNIDINMPNNCFFGVIMFNFSYWLVKVISDDERLAWAYEVKSSSY